MKMKTFGFILSLLILLPAVVSCNKKETTREEQPIVLSPVIREGKPAQAMPKATIFTMTGEYADKVGVTLNPDGSLRYYPAPSDITENSAPCPLKDGWYLNRQGLSANSVFTKWTFEEYAALPATPSREEIIDAIIPGARVAEMVEIPVSISQAMSDPAECLQFVPGDKGKLIIK